MSEGEDNAYKVLGIAQTSSQSDILQSFRKLSKKHHPDVGGNPAIYDEITKAYNKIRTPSLRADYDNGQGTQPDNGEDAEFVPPDDAPPPRRTRTRKQPPPPLIKPELRLHLARKVLQVSGMLTVDHVDSRLSTPVITWAWGDGKLATTRNYEAKHDYTNAGAYEVTVTADYSQNIVVHASSRITIYALPKINKISVDVSELSVSVSNIEYDTDSGIAFEYEWFDGQGFGNYKAHTYTTVGVKTLKVAAVNLGGRSDPFFKEFEVNWFPRILDLVYRRDGLNIEIEHVPLSNHALAHLTYDWGDGAPVTRRARHTYDVPRTYDVIVRSLNSAGQDEWCEEIKVGHKPTLVEVVAKQQELRVDAVLDAESVAPVEYVLDWNDPDDPSSETHHVYRTVGDKVLRVIARNEFGESAPVVKHFKVGRLPVISGINLEIDDLYVTVPTVTVQPDVDAEFIYRWNEDAGPSNSNWHLYPRDGSYTLSVQAKNFVGASQPVYRHIVLNRDRSRAMARQLLADPIDPLARYDAARRLHQAFLPALADDVRAAMYPMVPIPASDDPLEQAESLIRHLPDAIAKLRQVGDQIKRLGTVQANLADEAGRRLAAVPKPQPIPQVSPGRPPVRPRVDPSGKIGKIMMVAAGVVIPVDYIWGAASYSSSSSSWLFLLQLVIFLAAAVAIYIGYQVTFSKDARELGKDEASRLQGYDRQVLDYERRRRSAEQQANAVHEVNAARERLLASEREAQNSSAQKAKRFWAALSDVNTAVNSLIEVHQLAVFDTLKRRLD